MELPKYIRGAIFDLDGTLLDSLSAWADVDVRFFQKRGLKVPPDYYNIIKTMDLYEAALYTKALCGLDDPPEAMMEEWLSMIREEYALRISMKEGAAQYIERLHGEGILLGIATSSSPDLFLPALARHGVKDYFSSYTITREARGKEFPDVYLLAAKRLGLAPQNCAVFEDIPLGLKSAKAGGFYTVAVRNAEETGALGAYADAVIDRF